MVSSFLSFASTNEFQIYFFGIGPTETRVVFILINTFIIYAGTERFDLLLPLVVLLSLTGLVINVYQVQGKLWQRDMSDRPG